LGDELLDGKDKIKIRFDYKQNFILVDVNFQFLPLTFILDTGAEHIILFKKEYSDIIGLKYEKRINLLGSDLEEEVYALITRNVPITLPNAKTVSRDVIVLEEDFLHLDKLTGESIDGIIGGRFLRGLILEIDYRKQLITLHNKEKFRKNLSDFFKGPIEITNHKPYINAKMEISNNETIKLKLLLDTGAALPFLLFLDTHPSLNLPEHVIKGNLGRGLGGDLKGFMSKVRNLEILGEFNFPELLASYQGLEDDEQSEDLTFTNRNGLIGNPILERFKIYIDYVSQSLYLKPLSNFNKKFKYDMSGLVLYAFGPRLDNYYVKDVLEGSPANEAGILPGDKLLKMGILPIKFYTLPTVYKKLQKREGKKINMVVERNGLKIKKSFVLRDFFKKNKIKFEK